MTELEDVAALVRLESGIVIRHPQFPSLSAAIDRATAGLGLDGLLSGLARPQERDVLVDRLVEEVAVKETFFFRHKRELDMIDWRSRLEAAQRAGRTSLRVWSAACATGEEAYTLAIIAREALGALSPPVSILGTDISRSALEFACQAEYGPRSLREASKLSLERWFLGSGQRWRVAEEVRDMLQLGRHNLVRDPIPPAGEGKFDVIVCRNVLIYFDRATVERIIAGLERALHPGGMLVIGAADRLSGPLAPSAPRRRSTGTAEPKKRGGADASAPRSGSAATDRGAASARLPKVPSLSVTNAEEVWHGVHDWSLEETVRQTSAVIAREPLNVAAYFVHGVAQLAAGSPAHAVVSLRRALYLNPDFGLAAFKLGRAYDELNDTSAARRAYLRALHCLRPDDPDSAALLHQLDVADVAAACRARLAALAAR